MTKIAISPNVSGTGTFTLTAPNSNTDRTLTLPDAGGSVVLNEGSGTFKIDSSGNVGVGTSSPASPLHIYNSSPFIRLTDADLDTRHAIIGGQNGNFTIDIDPNQTAAGSLFSVNIDGTERARFVGSTLLFGKTEADLDLEGVGIQTNGVIFATRSSENCFIFNRTGSNGSIGLFRRNNTTVGNIAVTTTTTSYNTSSDHRLKEDVQPMVGASDRVLGLKPVNFAWKVDGTRVDGFLAHEAQAVVPEAVHGTKDEVGADGNPVYQGIDQSKLVPLLTAALQEALADIATLKAEVAALKGASA